MNKLSCVVAILTLGSTAAMAECVAPETPELPNGANATMDQMLEGQKAVKTFQTANVEYMQCLEPLIADAEAQVKKGTEEGAEAEAIAEAQKAYTEAVDAFNAAVSAEESVAGQFNTEIREFKAANPG